jgi:two-component system sensor histidine kinase/response regulator
LPETELRILAVDDQPTNLLLVKRQMERLGVAVDDAADGSQALLRVAQRFYPMILVDCEMPVMDGYEFTRQYRQLERDERRRTVIIALSARDPAEERQRCIDAGVDEFLVKPASLSDLKALIERHLRYEGDRRSGRSEEGAPSAQVIDWGRFVAIVGSDDPAIAREILTLFRDTVASTIEKLVQACRALDRSAVQSLAHRAKGAASNIAAIELSKVLETLETISESADKEILVRLAHSAQGSFQRVTCAIEARLAA